MAREKREIDFDAKKGADVRGPTPERLSKAGDAFVVGGEDRGVKIYYFADSPVQRLYARLRLRAGQRETEDLTKEYVALQKYRHHWYHAGLEAPLPSVDLNRVFASDPSNMVGMAKSERQADHRSKYRAAVEKVGHKPHILLENFVCYEHPLNVACHTIGYSMFRARRMVRDTAAELAQFWGIGW
ncbi:MAG: hypothetical protein JWP25_4707 [Bradyrhizobium sp.]|nr:hypothetical protein [Bradyrhizobium sp.]